MYWCLILIWAQGLRQADFLLSEALAGTVVTKGSISAEEGGSVHLQCHLSATTAKVTQVNWERQDQLLAVCHSEFGWHVNPVFGSRMAPGPGLSLTLKSLTRNDSGEYFCVYHTYPDGIYTGRIVLDVLGSSATGHRTGFQIPLLGALATVLGVACTAVIGVVALARKKKSHRIHSAASGLGSTPVGREEWRLSVPSPPGNYVGAEAAPAVLCGERGEDIYAEPHDYFNVLSYRSLGSFSFLAETA